MAGKRKLGPTRAANDFNVDNYPSVETVLAAIGKAVDDTDAPIERIELTALASGEATYRVTRARAEETEGGYFSPEDLS